MLRRRASSPGLVLLLLSLGSASIAGCLGEGGEAPAAAAAPPTDAPTAGAAPTPAPPADETAAPSPASSIAPAEVRFEWDGRTPRGVFVCSLPGCLGDTVADPQEWLTPVPGEASLRGVHLTLTWTPLDPTVGPLTFWLDRVAADGTVTNVVIVNGPGSPLEMVVDDLALADGESAQLRVFPVAKSRTFAGAVFVDASEQPFHVEGTLRVA